MELTIWSWSFSKAKPLSDRLRKGPLPLPQVLQFGVEIGEALDKAHRTGVVHRDLKPGNIMLTKSGAKLMDFGLAKGVPAPQATSVELTATVTSFAPDSAHPAGNHRRNLPVHGARAGRRQGG